MVCKKKVFFILMFVIISSSLLHLETTNTKVFSNTLITSLVIETVPDSPLYNYAVLISHYLREIGIDSVIRTRDKLVDVNGLYLFPDLAILKIEDDSSSPDMREYYTQEGIMNSFRLDRDMPYGNQSESMQEDGISITNLELRQQHYWEWQELMMDRLIPMLPLFSSRSYVAVWGNTIG